MSRVWTIQWQDGETAMSHPAKLKADPVPGDVIFVMVGDARHRVQVIFRCLGEFGENDPVGVAVCVPHDG